MHSLFWRLKNLSLFLMALAHALLGKMKGGKKERPDKILIIQGAKMGDMVCTTPLFRGIKKVYPNCTVVVVGDAVNKKLLDGHPYVDQYIVWQKNFWNVAGEIRKVEASAGLLVLPSLESLALLLCAQVPHIIVPKIIGGASPYETVTYKVLSIFAEKVPHHFDHYAPREYLRLLEPLGIVTDDTKKYLTYSKIAKDKINSMFRNYGIDPKRDMLVAIVPGVGGDQLKIWGARKFAQVTSRLLLKPKLFVLVIGAGKDADQVNAMLSFLPENPRLINLLDKLSLDELKALVSSLSLLVSADTGPIYIAEAFETPTIDILGPVKENVQPPRGPFHRVMYAPRARGQMGVLDNIPSDLKEAERQSQEIDAQMVIDEIDSLLRAGFLK